MTTTDKSKRLHKQGDIREDGKIFFKYSARMDGALTEHWVTTKYFEEYKKYGEKWRKQNKGLILRYGEIRKETNSRLKKGRIKLEIPAERLRPEDTSKLGIKRSQKQAELLAYRQQCEEAAKQNLSKATSNLAPEWNL
jgi:hypothetical protein